jgi:hypothetical protein
MEAAAVIPTMAVMAEMVLLGKVVPQERAIIVQEPVAVAPQAAVAVRAIIQLIHSVLRAAAVDLVGYMVDQIRLLESGEAAELQTLVKEQTVMLH